MLKGKNVYRLFIAVAIVLLAIAWIAFSGSGHEAKGVVVYRIARDPIWNPIDFMGKEREVTAFSDELIRSIAEEEGMRVSFASTGASALLGGLTSDQYDAILTGVLPSPTTEEEFLYSKTFYRYGPVVVVSSDSTVTDLKGLEGKIVGVERGASTIFNLPIGPKISLVGYDNILDALDAMSRGKIDAVILNMMPAYLYAQSLFRGNVRPITAPLSDEGLRLVALHDTPGAEFIDAFNKGLEKMKSDGRYDALLKRWGLPNPEKE